MPLGMVGGAHVTTAEELVVLTEVMLGASPGTTRGGERERERERERENVVNVKNAVCTLSTACCEAKQ